MPHKDPATRKAYARARYLARRDMILAASAARNRASGKSLRGPKHGLSATREWKMWESIKQRCLNPRSPYFPGYGGRGIRLHNAWVDDAPAFIDYVVRVMGPKPTPQHSIDRIDNDGHYEPGNLRWASRAEQARNRRDTKLTALDVRLVRHWRERGFTYRAIAGAFGISCAAAQKIIANRLWKEAA